MKIAILEESHNHVSWSVRTPLPWIALGLAGGYLALALLIGSTSAPARWTILTILAATVAIVLIALALSVPLTERGHLERGPESGHITLTRLWLFYGKRIACQVPLDAIEQLTLQDGRFRSEPNTSVTLARLQIVRIHDSPITLTGWAEPEQLETLRQALVKAGRLTTLPAQE